jgi:signal transduction histidine kinase
MYFSILNDSATHMEITIRPNQYLTKSKCFFIITLFFFIFQQTKVFSQSNPELGYPLITNYSPKVYKGHGQVWGVIQSDNGVMYFGTSAGITEYDGVNWRQISISDSVIFQTVRGFEKGKDGKIFFGGGQNFGYIEFDNYGIAKAFSLLELVKPEFRNFSDIRSINLKGDFLFVQSKEYLFRINLTKLSEGGEFKAWKADSFFVYSMIFENELYIFQLEKGLYQLKGENLEIVPGSDIFKNTRVYIMLPIPDKEIGDFKYLVGTASEGFFGFTGKSFVPFKTELDPLLKDQFLYRSITLPNGNFVVSLIGKGIFIMNPEGKVLRNINYEAGLQDESVYWSYLDSSDMLWLGLDNGISKVELSPSITTFSKQSGLKTGILSIQRVQERLVIGTPIGISTLNKNSGKFEQIDFGGGTQVFDMLPIGEDLIFRTINGIGVLKGDLQIGYELADSWLSGSVFLNSKHLDQRVIVGSGLGVAVIRKKAGNTNWEKEGHFPGNFHGVWTLAETKEGDIWAGTQSGYAYKITPVLDQEGNLDFAKSKIVTYGGENQEKAGDGVIYGVAGKIFSLSENGFFSYNPESEKFELDDTFGKIEIDYSSTDNFNLKEDDLGRVWVTIKNKIRLATPLPNGGYKLEDDLFNGYPWEDITTIFPERNGIVWIGSGDGLVRMEIQKEKSVQRPFSILLRQAITKTDTLSLDAAEGISLQQSNNSLRFMYAAPFFEQEDRTVYQTYLEGFDPDWTDWGTNSYKEYTNLATGTYTFRVRAKNLYNVISEESTYTFTILPPWYATWWAYLIYLFCVVGIGYLIYISQKKRLLAKEREKSRERELAQAKEIEKAYENLKATQEQLIQQEKLASLGQLTAGIAHEIKNPLNFVNNFSELSMEYVDEISESVEKLDQNDTTEDIKSLLGDVRGNLAKIFQHGSRADGIVRSMLMHSRGGKGIKEPTDLNELIKEYVNLAFHGMRASKNPINVDIKVQLEEDLPKVMLNPEDFSRVILNLCKNAFDAMRDKTELHGKDYLPKLSVSTKNLEDSVMVVVEDNGPGVPEDIRDKLLMPFFTTKKGTEGTGLGLSITHDIIKDHEGVLEIDSIVGEYTRFIILIPKTQ